jgi:hypothetical protein
VFEVTLGENFRYPPSTQRYNSTPLDLKNNIYFQNIDIYVDTDPTPGSGWSMCIPGRRVAFADGTPGVCGGDDPPAGRGEGRDRGSIRHRGVPPGALPHQPSGPGEDDLRAYPDELLRRPAHEGLGLLGARLGARWERTFAVVDRIAGRHDADAYTMPVIGVREAWMFGGAPSAGGKAHPWVVDVLLPPGASQAKVLGSYDEKTGAYAQVPFVYGSGKGAAADRGDHGGGTSR